MAAAMPTPAIHRPSVPPVIRPRNTPPGAMRAALITRRRNQNVTALWFARNRASTSAVGRSRICGYSKTVPSAVNPAMARRDASPRDDAAMRGLVGLLAPEAVARSVVIESSWTGKADGGCAVIEWERRLSLLRW